MKWRINQEGLIYDERNEVVCVLPAKQDSHNTALILHAPEMFEAIAEFCASLGSAGNPRHPKKQYIKLQNLLIKIDDDAAE